MANRYRDTVDTEFGPRKVLKVVVKRAEKKPLVAVFGGIPLRTSNAAKISDRVIRLGFSNCELIQRLLADRCEMCGCTENIEVHHIRKLADLKKPGRKEKPLWIQKMAAIRRKTLVVCKVCHEAIHHSKTRAEWTRLD
jgi:hypothetical protein